MVTQQLCFSMFNKPLLRWWELGLSSYIQILILFSDKTLSYRYFYDSPHFSCDITESQRLTNLLIVICLRNYLKWDSNPGLSDLRVRNHNNLYCVAFISHQLEEKMTPRVSFSTGRIYISSVCAKYLLHLNKFRRMPKLLLLRLAMNSKVEFLTTAWVGYGTNRRMFSA